MSLDKAISEAARTTGPNGDEELIEDVFAAMQDANEAGVSTDELPPQEALAVIEVLGLHVTDGLSEILVDGISDANTRAENTPSEGPDAFRRRLYGLQQ